MFHERFGINFEWVGDQKGNIRKSILINNDAYDKLGWRPKKKLVHYIMSL